MAQHTIWWNVGMGSGLSLIEMEICGIGLWFSFGTWKGERAEISQWIRMLQQHDNQH